MMVCSGAIALIDTFRLMRKQMMRKQRGCPFDGAASCSCWPMFQLSLNNDLIIIEIGHAFFDADDLFGAFERVIRKRCWNRNRLR